MAIKQDNTYFTPVRKRTSIGNSSRSKPKNKHKLKSWKRYNRQGKWVVAQNGGSMTTEVKDNSNYQVQLLNEINKKVSLQRNEAHNRIAHLEIMIESNQREIQALKAELEGNKLFKENNKKDK